MTPCLQYIEVEEVKVAHLCLTLCDPMDCILYYLPEFA